MEVGSAEGETQVLELAVGQVLTLGSGPRAGLRLADPTVSARHCELTVDEMGMLVRDLGSKNGLFVGGARVPQARLDPGGASFVIGRSTVTVRPARSAPPATVALGLPGIVGTSEAMRRQCFEVEDLCPGLIERTKQTAFPGPRETAQHAPLETSG